MSTGILVINFGEPDEPTPQKVQLFLERIFLQNAGLEPGEAAVRRARQLARDRTPGLVEEYRGIGGSPLNTQAVAQTRALQQELRTRGWDVRTYAAFQFTSPSIEETVARARAEGAKRLIAVPAYPLCGRSTTVAALEDVRRALVRCSWTPEYLALSGWHHATAYVQLRADAIDAFTRERGLDLKEADTLLHFSAHGTPIKYLDGGNRYDRYVEEHCRTVAKRLGVDKYAVGFQNHTNRRIRWTQPANEDRIRRAEEQRIVVVPISFMHEQSETLAELDQGLRAFVEGLGKEFHRVPVPHDALAFVSFLADAVTDLLEGSVTLSRCRCVAQGNVWCTNGNRDLPLSAYAHPVDDVGETVRAPAP